MEVVDELVHSGMTHPESMQIVEQICYELKKTVKEEKFSPEVMPFAVLGGLIAAVISGAAWGGIAIWTGLEIGYVAWGVGLLCGVGVLTAAQGKRGMPLQIIAVVTGVLGIVIGKYISFAYAQASDPFSWMSIFSMGRVQLFVSDLSAMVSGFDWLWMALAVYTAWSIPKASRLKF